MKYNFIAHDSLYITFSFPKAADLFVENLKLYLAGKSLKYVVDWARGY